MNTNSLINEMSPYLLQHSHNPINWFAWNDSAFLKAEKEDKPIFLSIGYSTCHWCHVMAEESFEDSEVSKILNESFIAIKVDREERPDIDSIYMNACQMLTGSGGWPLTIVMTPSQQPFFAGTYFPKHTNFRMPGLIEILNEIKNEWKSNKQSLVSRSSAITDILKTDELSENKGDSVKNAYENLRNSFDEKYGGFGRSPKFPVPSNILFLLEYHHRLGGKHALNMANTTLLSMYRGGIFDHIGYGFSRYSTDRMWLIPHFEKMLYDNAQLIYTYSQAYEETGTELYRRIAERCIEYVESELKGQSGGYYSAQDADSLGKEGLFYAFSPTEIIDVLGKKDGKKFNEIYGVTEAGNFEGAAILNLLANKDISDISAIENDNTKLFKYRKERYALHRDDKILTSWNCLMIAALAKTYSATNEISHLNAALQAFSFINENLVRNKNIYTVCRKDKCSEHGFLDDYAFYIYACISLYKVTFDFSFIKQAEAYLTEAIEEFFDPKQGGFYLTKKSEKQSIIRPKEIYDSVLPSGNSMMYYNLLHLIELLDDSSKYTMIYRKQKDFLEKSQLLGGQTFFAYSILIETTLKKIICVINSEEDRSAIIEKRQRLNDFDIVKIIRPTETYPLKDGKTTYYICKDNSCFPPQNEIDNV